jgi:phosphodiesterase/alkaline phosphatase D-like protein
MLNFWPFSYEQALWNMEKWATKLAFHFGDYIFPYATIVFMDLSLEMC